MSGAERPPSAPRRARALITTAVRAFAGVALAGLGLVASSAPAVADECPAGVLNVVAHQDDDLIFLSPDLLHDVEAGRCVRTVYLTAGDAGLDESYWGPREAGPQAAYAAMAGVTNEWTTADAEVDGREIELRTLAEAPRISLVFLRLPDGLPDGSGTAVHGGESLEKLWNGRAETVTAVDGSETYTRDDLLDTLAALMTGFRPVSVRTQDWTGEFGGPDHSDHAAAARFAREAHGRYDAGHTLAGYLGYPGAGLPQNVAGEDLDRKIGAFVAYAAHDPWVCMDGCPDPQSLGWLTRQYVVGTEALANLAPSARVTASAEDAAGGGVAVRAVDGAWGASGSAAGEWSSGGGAGEWIELAWDTATTIDGVALYDRTNLDDHVLAGRLVFSDGSVIPVGPLANNGAASVVTFSPRTVASVRLEITEVADTTADVGLAEFEAFAGTPRVNRPPVADAGPGQVVAAGTRVRLTGATSADPNGDALTFTWRQTGGQEVVLDGGSGAAPEFTAPSEGAALTFTLTVDDGTTASQPSTVTVTVEPPPRGWAAAAGPVLGAVAVVGTVVVVVRGIRRRSRRRARRQLPDRAPSP